MNPDQAPVLPNESQTPAYQPATTLQPTRRNSRKIAAIWLLVGPTALVVLSIAAYAIANLILNNTASIDSSGTELFGQQSVAVTVTNIALFITGAIGVIAWLPGIVIGIVLLATQKK